MERHQSLQFGPWASFLCLSVALLQSIIFIHRIRNNFQSSKNLIVQIAAKIKICAVAIDVAVTMASRTVVRVR